MSSVMLRAIFTSLLVIAVAATPVAAHPAQGAPSDSAQPGRGADVSGDVASDGPGTAMAATTRRLALGVSMLPYDDLGVVDAFIAATGRAPATWSVWVDWGGSNSSFPTQLLEGLRERGITPLIIWEPVDPRDLTRDDFTFRQINLGAHDVYLRDWATAARAYGGRVLIRFAHEFDGQWFPWGVGNFDNTAKGFVTAWKRIWNTFRGTGGVGADNVRFMWSPVSPCTCEPDLYPGDAYVDYVAFTGFNWGTQTRPWRTMLEAFRKKYDQARQITSKRIIVAETGAGPVGGDKAAWVRDGYRAVYRELPAIKAISYFNIDMRNVAQPDWRLTSPAGALDEYRSLLTRVRFQGSIR